MIVKGEGLSFYSIYRRYFIVLVLDFYLSLDWSFPL